MYSEPWYQLAIICNEKPMKHFDEKEPKKCNPRLTLMTFLLEVYQQFYILSQKYLLARGFW